MKEASEQSAETPCAAGEHFDAIVIGAGLAGMYQLIRLRELGLSVKVFEAGSDVGGVWYWNRYPGARFDSESYTYGYSFSPELLQDWSWSETFARQPENLRYVKLVADKFDLRRDIRFHTRVSHAHFDVNTRRWALRSGDEPLATCTFLITAVGPLSVPQWPAIDGIGDFEGESYHTGRWPHHDVTLDNRRVGIIGTGASGVQVIQTIASEVSRLTVFQRTPEYCLPLGNTKISADEMASIRSRYPQIFDACRASFGAYVHDMDPRSALEMSPEERTAIYEERYAKPGFAFWLGNFYDIFTDQAANDTISNFVREKIRGRVNDPDVAARLVPEHGFGLRRVPMEIGYYEAYNRDNVELVDLRKFPITRITKSGIETTRGSYDLDVLIFATGFNALVGGIENIDIRGTADLALKDKWISGPRTYLGVQSAGFPNLFFLVGPHNAATFCNVPRCIEYNVEWVTDLIAYASKTQHATVSVNAKAEDKWTRHVYDRAAETLFPTVDSWFMNVNINQPEKQRNFLSYTGGLPAFRALCAEEAAGGYPSFDFR